MGGAVTAPYEHQLALDHLHRQLEAAGVPSQLVVDILTGQPDKISVPTEISKKHQLFISGTSTLFFASSAVNRVLYLRKVA